MYIDTHQRPSGHALHHLSDALKKRTLEALNRRKLNKLLELDDHLLNDIGVERHEVESASRMPLSVDAATELRRMSLARRRWHI